MLVSRAVPDRGRRFTPGTPLTIVGYHYVRPLGGSCYPRLKALDLAAFRRQLLYCRRHYNFVSIEAVLDAVEGGDPLPERPILLTFDDGYADHYVHVLPVLEELGVRGAVYPPAAAVLEQRVLDVNKIHLILASVSGPEELIPALERRIREADAGADVLPVEEYRKRFWVSNRFDPAPVLYCKQLLQHALPETLRRDVADELFGRFVSADEAAFAADLYVSVPQLREMHARGMHVGGHGGRHCWLDRLDAAAQRVDIAESFRLFQALGLPQDEPFTFCYPYGGYNDVTLHLLRERCCRAALTVRTGLAELSPEAMLELPRIDTNDLPADPDAPPGPWTTRAATRPA
jgi:peptidoglycan/xylan/chitin deacetylase (PgdA/CDA1 family)